ncbi:MAG: Rrf2 family transcriptional regulator [Chloroflexi bacterium]|nr:Rrf2 family transcriptional regulator [Chloroflexota bacterium]
MEITRQADYAVRAVLEIAKLPDGRRASTSEIARQQGIPLTFLAKIVAQLAVSGIVHTTLGAHGGVTLARSPESISMLEVIEAIDGPITLNACVADGAYCVYSNDCPVRDVWCDVQAGLADKLRSTTFAQLIGSQDGAGARAAS